MADIKTGVNLLFLREEELNQGMELLYYGYRGFTADADAILARHGFGRAHHRVLYFVGRNPGISIAELLGILSITKQSLSRVLNQLVAEDCVALRPGARDRRMRLLSLTEKGAQLERQLSGRLRARVARAYRDAGADAVEGYRKVMTGLVGDNDRQRLARKP